MTTQSEAPLFRLEVDQERADDMGDRGGPQ